MSENLLVEKRDNIGIITFNRPTQLNAMNRDLMDQIVAACKQFNEDDSVHVVIVTGKGTAFMAGADIKEYSTQTEEQFEQFQRKGIQLYEAMEQGNKPYIAMVNGYALGGGFEIACACDFIVASEKAKFGLPEVHLGLIPGGGGTQRLIQKIGVNRVKEMLYFGGQYTAKEMKEWGIANFVFEEDALEEECMKLANKLARRSKGSIQELKRLVNISLGTKEFQERLLLEGEAVAKLFQSEEAKKKIEEFMNR